METVFLRVVSLLDLRIATRNRKMLNKVVQAKRSETENGIE
jgi:hypothetical protein